MNEMHDFVLKVMPSDTGYFIHAECLSVGEAGPLSIEKNALTGLEGYSCSTATSVGRNLHQAIIRNEIHELFERALAVAESQSVGLRLLLKFSQLPELHKVPWELLHDEHEFLAINPKTPVVRYLEQPQKVDSLEVKPPIRILFTTACPQGEIPLDLATEERYMRKALDQLGKKVDFVVERHISIRQLRYALMRAQNRENRPFHIWHHCGHGGILDGKFMLALEERGKKALTDVSQLSILVKACPALRVVTLNVCHGASAVGLAPALATLNVPAVIGFRGSILDQSALTFAEAFYEAIFYAPLDVALGQARMALATQNKQALDWSLPLLFLRTTNPLILKTEAAAQPQLTNTTLIPMVERAPVFPVPSPDQSVDFVLVTALAEERDAVLGKLPEYQQLPPFEDDIRTYFQSTLPVTFPDGSTGMYNIVVMPLLGMGRVQAATATVDAVRRWHPRYLLLVGIAGGVAARGVKVGDILISTQIVDYELQKLTPQGPEVRWEVYRADARLLGAYHNFRDKSWQELMQMSRPGPGQPEHHAGPIASGDKVIAFDEVVTRHRDVWSKLVGVEMEASGVATAAFQSPDPPGFFMVRGVSDLADEKKGSLDVEKWRLYACDAAASFAIALLKSGPIPCKE